MCSDECFDRCPSSAPSTTSPAFPTNIVAPSAAPIYAPITDNTDAWKENGHRSTRVNNFCEDSNTPFMFKGKEYCKYIKSIVSFTIYLSFIYQLKTSFQYYLGIGLRMSFLELKCGY
jgi:hypothetical protein